MEARTVCILLALGLACLLAAADAKKYKMVAYWGQNGVYNKKVVPKLMESDLSTTCRSSKYDVVVLSFMHIFFDTRNKDRMPGLNFAYHCETPVDMDHPSLLRCPKIEKAIIECQQQGKEVLMSLGGAAGRYGFGSAADARTFAQTVWDLLLGGDKLKSIRPFGSAILDGVDLDIEGGSSLYYTDFVKEFRAITSQDKSKHYIVGAAPQCPFPDGYLGPFPGKALGDVGYMFDEIYIQFYNNWCHTGNTKVFWENVAKWLKFSADNSPSPKILVGMPGDPNGASNNAANFRPPSEAKAIFDGLKSNPNFGGFMIWDAGFDEHNVINGKKYSDHLVSIMSGGSAPNPVTRDPATQGTNAPAPSTQQPIVTNPSPKATTSAPVRPASVSCTGLADGHYAHPKDCAKFFICAQGTAYVKDCPPGLNWNQTAKICDWPRNVQCV